MSLFLLLLCGARAELAAQATGTPRVEATRAELEATVAHPPKGMSSADLAVVRRRLADGDFAVGDRILVEVTGEPDLTGTFTVSGTRTLQMPNLPPLPLEGVLRSESDSVIHAFLARFVKDPQVRVQPLIRLGVLGGVVKPGYYDVPAQSLLSEVVMTAGGIGGLGRMDKSVVYRGNDELLDSKAVNIATTNGTTLDLLNLQSGDNLQVGIEKAGGALTKVQIITGLLAIPIMIFTITALAK